MDNKSELKQLKVYVTPAHFDMLAEYGRKHGIVADRGIHAGKPHNSEIVRLAIEQLCGESATASTAPPS